MFRMHLTLLIIGTLLSLFVHWARAGSFIIAYLTYNDEFHDVHILAGLTSLLMLSGGFINHFLNQSNLKKKTIISGHRSLFVWVLRTGLFLSILMTCLSGLAIFLISGRAGVPFLSFFSINLERNLILSHYFCAKATLIFVVVHVLGVLLYKRFDYSKPIINSIDFIRQKFSSHEKAT